MLILNRESGAWQDSQFDQLPEQLRAGDVLVLNDSRVIPARLFGTRVGNHPGKVEVLLTEQIGDWEWRALTRPARRMTVGRQLSFAASGGDEPLEATVTAHGEFGERLLRFTPVDDFFARLEHMGHVPLPPYIRRHDETLDRERYQTVYAQQRGSVAAPTAGLHFTPQILAECQRAGAAIAEITLHVGLGTFQPVRGEKLHAERFEIPPESAQRIDTAYRVVCVGTTSVRAVESSMLGKNGETDLFIRPGFQFQKTGAMLTNFHLPQSSLLMLVCALAGQNLVLAAYRHAVEAGYRFYSYGDCMLIV